MASKESTMNPHEGEAKNEEVEVWEDINLLEDEPDYVKVEDEELIEIAYAEDEYREARQHGMKGISKIKRLEMEKERREKKEIRKAEEGRQGRKEEEAKQKTKKDEGQREEAANVEDGRQQEAKDASRKLRPTSQRSLSCMI